MKAVRKSALLKTSSGNDVLSSGGVLSITGLDKIRKNDILAISQAKYKAEVVQVVTLANTDTPTASTTYAIEIVHPQGKREGFSGRKFKYAYTTPAVLTTIGANAAAQREYIHDQIVDKINLDSTNHVVAASSGGGAGLTITDDAGYYPARNSGNSGRKGAPTILAITNSDGSGFTQSQISVTTDAVYAFGEGSRMDDDIPVIYAYEGNLVSGELDAPVAIDGTYATAGQKYDAFTITSLTTAPAHAVTGQLAHTLQEQTVFVDNGTGTSTTNLTGFFNFQRAMFRVVGNVFSQDPNAIVDLFDTIGVFSGSATPAPIGTTGAVNQMDTGKNVLQYFIKGAGSTILAPYATTTGLPLSLDATDDEGMELSAPVGSNSPIGEFVVGKQECSLYARINLDDVSGTDALYVGFRKKEAHQAVPDNYDEMAALSLIANAGDINISTILNNAATVNTDTTKNWADGETKELEVKVLADGTVKFFVDGVDVSDVQATAFEFDANEIIIPFIAYLHTADIGVPLLKELVVLPSATWRI